MKLLKNITKVFIWFGELPVRAQQNHIDVQVVINSFPWRPRTQWPGLNMMWNHGATGIPLVGIREMPENQELKGLGTLRATEI
jgi:hypothetical protein